MNRVDDMPGYLIALTASLVMCALLLMLQWAPQSVSQSGCVLTNPQGWIPTPWLNATTAFLLLWIVSACMTSLNRTFNLEAGTSALASSFFLISTAAVPILVWRLTPGLLMALGAIMALRLLFSAYEREDTTRTMFLVASTLSFGVMADYAFVAMIVAALLAAISMQEITIRSAAAFLLGIITPWLLVFGFGVADISTFQWPNPWQGEVSTSYTTVLAAGVTALTVILLLMRRAVMPPNRTSRATAMNRAVAICTMVTIVAAGADFHNFATYIPTLNLLAGFAISGMAGDRDSASPTLLIGVLTLIYITLYILAI